MDDLIQVFFLITILVDHYYSIGLAKIFNVQKCNLKEFRLFFYDSRYVPFMEV